MKLDGMERLPFDVLKHLLICAVRCGFFGWELLRLRLVSRTWLRACDSPAVVRVWHAVNSDYVVWEVRTCRWQPPWPTNAPAVAEAVRKVSRFTNYGWVPDTTPGGLALLHWVVCEALVGSLRNGQTRRPFFTGVRGRGEEELCPEDDPDDSEYVDETCNQCHCSVRADRESAKRARSFALFNRRPRARCD
jgi:hypothetical protein